MIGKHVVILIGDICWHIRNTNHIETLLQKLVSASQNSGTAFFSYHLNRNLAIINHFIEQVNMFQRSTEGDIEWKYVMGIMVYGMIVGLKCIQMNGY